MTKRVRIGDMLVAAKMVTPEQVAEALAAQRDSGRRLGEELVAKGFVTEIQLTQVLSNQLSVPWVSLQRIEFTRDLLNLVPAEVANRLCVIPIYVRAIKSKYTLYVAMDDPSNEDVIEELTAAVGLPIKTMVSPPSEIRHAIRVYYFGAAPQVAPESRRASRHPEASEAARVELSIPKTPKTGLFSDVTITGESEAAQPPEGGEATTAAPAPQTRAAGATDSNPDEPAEIAQAAAPDAPVVPNESAAGQASEGGGQEASQEAPARPATIPPKKTAVIAAQEVRQAQAPEEPEASSAEAGVQMVTLTLLDGTTVRLPAPGSKKKAERASEGALTASDLVSALLARAQGADVSDVLPDGQWEVLFASLLSLLIRKGLLADWEFVEEWKKRQGS